MDNNQQREVKGIWIPIEIWKNSNLSWNEKILFLEIDSYTSADKDCFFSNEYIAKLLGVNETNANKILSSLITKGYVIKTRFDGRHRYVKTALSYSTTLPCQKEQPCLVENDNPSRAHDNTIDTTIVVDLINKDNKEEKEKELKEKFSSFVNLYRQLTGKHTRGVDTEFEAFRKRHKDWKEVIPLLSDAIQKETNARNLAKSKGEFFAEPKMLETYLGKKRAWEMYTNSENDLFSTMSSKSDEIVINGQVYR